MKIKNISIAVFFVLLLGLIAYRIMNNPSDSGKKDQKGDKKPPMTVDAIVVNTQNYAASISLSGSIEASENVEVRSEVSGIVEKIYFTEGTFVKQGQALLKISDLELKALLAQAKTKQNLASENYRRAKLLLEKEAISVEEHDMAKAEFQSLQAQTQVIQAQLSKTTIKAAFSGKIGLRNISAGAYITPTTLITKLVSTNDVKISFAVPEKYASEIKDKSKISFTIPNQTSTFTATIYAVEPEIDTQTRTLKIKALATNPNGALVAGTFATIALPLKQNAAAILIPSEAVVPVQKGKVVFLAKNGKAKEIPITTTSRTDKEVLVSEGIKAGDTLIISGIMALKDDADIKVKLK